METSSCQLLPLRTSTERGFSMSCLQWLFAGGNHPKRRARSDVPALPMSNVPAPSDTVMLAWALAGRTITPRNNRNKSGDVEQKADFLIRGLSAEILCPCLVWGTARSGTPGRTRTNSVCASGWSAENAPTPAWGTHPSSDAVLRSRY